MSAARPRSGNALTLAEAVPPPRVRVQFVTLTPS